MDTSRADLHRRPEPNTEPALEQRLRRLERALRAQQALTAGVLILLVAVTALGASHQVPDVIRARRIEVVDRSGRTLVALRGTVHGGQVQTVGLDGVSGVSIGATANGGFVGVRDKNPTLFPRVELATDDSGGTFAVRNWNGFAIEIDRDGLAVAHTQEDSGFTRVDPRVVLSVNEHGGRLRVLNATGEEAAVIGADAAGTGVVSTHGGGGVHAVLRP